MRRKKKKNSLKNVNENEKLIECDKQTKFNYFAYINHILKKKNTNINKNQNGLVFDNFINIETLMNSFGIIFNFFLLFFNSSN